MDIEIPETSSHGRFEQTVTVLIGMATVVAALLVNLDLAAHRHQARASAEATRLAVAAFRTMTTGSLDLGAKTTAMTRVVDLVSLLASGRSLPNLIRSFRSWPTRSASLENVRPPPTCIPSVFVGQSRNSWTRRAPSASS
jgi:hypothetical protein